jgi:hypothetical protein
MPVAYVVLRVCAGAVALANAAEICASVAETGVSVAETGSQIAETGETAGGEHSTQGEHQPSTALATAAYGRIMRHSPLVLSARGRTQQAAERALNK